MATYDAAKDRAPLGHLGGLPLFGVTILVIAHVAALVVCALLRAAGVSLDGALFWRDEVLRGQVWRFVSYAFVHFPDLWTVFGLYLLFWFGRQIETFLGRRAFLRMYALLLLLPPVLLLPFPGANLVGAGEAHFAVFVAFATLYPRAMIWCVVPAAWFAAAIIAIYALQDLALHAWSDLLVLLGASFAAFAIVRYEQGRWTFRRTATERERETKFVDQRKLVNVDALLDKIGREGLHSLTAKEREQLEKAREDLLRR